MDKKQIKTRERVRNHGEVFTAEREVKAMCDLVKDETERIDSRFLEPACGDGNFLAEILERKLNVVKKRYSKSKTDYEKNAFIAISSLYGVDILIDNVFKCRDRLLNILLSQYKKIYKTSLDDELLKSIQFLLSRNIVLGNALSMLCVDEKGIDTNEPIIFSEWSFVNELVKRRDFRFDVLLKENPDEKMYSSQLSLFDDDADNYEYWMIDPLTKEPIPKPVKEFELIDYRRVYQYE